MPVHMGVVTPTPTVLVPTAVTVTQKPMLKKDLAALRAKESDDSSGPTTTVFVGNISEKASDMLVRQLLAKCGIVLSWKRVQGASGKLQAFGFCEYKEPDSTLRALRLLHELLLGDKKLLVKVDAKTKAQLDEWKAKKKSANGDVSSESKNGDEDDEEEEVLDEETLRRDQVVKGAIEVLIREYSSELNAPSQDPDSQPRKKRKEKKEEDINAMEMEDDKRDLISREISKFRDTHKVMYQTVVNYSRIESVTFVIGKFLYSRTVFYFCQQYNLLKTCNQHTKAIVYLRRICFLKYKNTTDFVHMDDFKL